MIHLPNISGWRWFGISIVGIFSALWIVEIVRLRLPRRFDLYVSVLHVVILFVLFWKAFGLLQIDGHSLNSSERVVGLMLLALFQFMLADFIDAKGNANRPGLAVVQEGAALQFTLPSGQAVFVNSVEFTNDTLSNSQLFDDFHKLTQGKGKAKAIRKYPALHAYLEARVPSSNSGARNLANDVDHRTASKRASTGSKAARESQGVRRLAVALGGIGSIPGAALIALELNSGTGVTDGSLLAIVGFAIPFGMVHLVHWIVRGFAADRIRINEPTCKAEESKVQLSSQPASQKTEELKSTSADSAEMELRKKALNGDVTAQFELGRRNRYSDDTESVKWLKLAGDSGHIDAQKMLIDYYRWGPTKDKVEEAKWSRKLAEQGDADAACSLAMMYVDGKGVPQSFSDAARWYRFAAEKGELFSAVFLGDLYNRGVGVPQDRQEAQHWFDFAGEQAIKTDNSFVMSALGSVLSDERGALYSLGDSIKWHTMAADQGNTSSMTELAKAYMDGVGVEQNFQLTIEWCKTAAEQGDPIGKALLGKCYLLGLGVTIDHIQALSWLLRSGFTAVDWVNTLTAEARENMSADEIAEAEKLASKWNPQEY